MPVRRIPPSRRAITGRLAAAKSIGAAHYESALERDFLITLEADLTVLNYETQPLRLSYTDAQGRPRSYTPDVLVRREHRTELCEVKYTDDIRALRTEHKDRWIAAFRHATQQGWAFRLVTEHHARHPRSRNWLFLSPFRAQAFSPETLATLAHAAHPSFSLTVRDWLTRLPEPQAEWIGAIWHLIATGQVVTDLTLPLTLDTLVYVAPLSAEERP